MVRNLTVHARRPSDTVRMRPESGSDSVSKLASILWVRECVDVDHSCAVPCELIVWTEGKADLMATKLGGRPAWPAHVDGPVNSNGAPLEYIGQFDLRESRGVLPKEWGLYTHIFWFRDPDWSEWGDGVELPIIGVPMDVVSGVASFDWQGPTVLIKEWCSRSCGMADLLDGGMVMDDVVEACDREPHLRPIVYREMFRPHFSRIGGLPCGNSESVVDGVSDFYLDRGEGCVAQLVLPADCEIDYPVNSGVATLRGPVESISTLWGYL